jgi:gliding motility-associated-like protein
LNKPLLILFILIGSLAFGQNLIYNGDFEIYDDCPENTSGPGNLQIEHCTGWTAPTQLGTSDYFNVCNNSTPFHPVGVPSNAFGYQEPYNGSGYCGIFSWDIDFGFEYREYIQTKLTEPLTNGKEYQLTFYVSNQGYNYSLKKLGGLFSENSYSANNYSPIVANPQVVNQDDFLIDSLEWIKIEGNFIANGNEEYLTIGYFEDSSDVADTLNSSGTDFFSKSTYYYIDGVELIEVSESVSPETILIPNVITPNGDGINEAFELPFSYSKVSILNRWGNLIWGGSEGQYWNGKTQEGIDVSEGTYFYIIETDIEKHQGFVQVVR